MLSQPVNCRDRVSRRHQFELLPPAIKKWNIANKKRFHLSFRQNRKERFEVPVATRFENDDLLSKGASPRFHILHVEFRPRIIRVNDKSNHGSRRNKFAQQLQALRHKDGREQGYTRDVAAWPIET